MSQWLEATRSVLLRLRDRTGAWGYRADRGPTSEATALCCLGLWSSRRLSLSKHMATDSFASCIPPGGTAVRTDPQPLPFPPGGTAVRTDPQPLPFPPGGTAVRTDPQPLPPVRTADPTNNPGRVLHAELEAINRGADWLRQLQQADGSIGVSPGLPHPGWATPYCLLLWKALDVHLRACQKASAWLLQEKGAPVDADQVLNRMIVGDDQSLLGWPWVDGTHSWLEPTALAIIALDRQGLGDHPRVEEGIKLILDRALHSGGWNYGNKSVFGRALRPHPEPTAMALLALAARRANKCPRAVDPALRYLRQVLPGIDAPCSTAWGVLGLRAWNACPAEADAWLARSFARHGGRRDITAGLGLLALAGGEPDVLTGKPLP
ncbi:MAG: hypothetical protein ACP5XB_06120 [Isosphaeraceae bacterium]